jgi:FecR protein
MQFQKNRNKYNLSTFSLLMFFTLCGWFPIKNAYPKENIAEKPIGNVGSLLGQATIFRNNKPLPVQKGMEVYPNDTLTTESNAAVKLTFTDGGTFMAFEKASVKISEYALKKEAGVTSLKSAFEIAKGKVRFFVKPDTNKKIDAKYKTSNAVMGIRGTSGFIDATNPEKTKLFVLTGKVEVSNPKFPLKTVLVTKNLMSEIDLKEAPSAPKLVPPTIMQSLNTQALAVDSKPDSFEAPKDTSSPQEPNTPADDKNKPKNQPLEQQDTTSTNTESQSTPEANTAGKKIIFNPNGEQSVSVQDENLNSLQREQKIFGEPAGSKKLNNSSLGENSSPQPIKTGETQIIKNLNEQIQVNSEKAKELRDIIREKSVSSGAASNEITTKDVKIKIVLPEEK